MQTRTIAATSTLLVIAFISTPVPAQQLYDGTGEARRLRESITVFTEVMAAEDSAIPARILERAEAIAIFPGTIKGGFIIGALRGHGVLSARGDTGWTSPAFLTLTGGSIGLQIGGQAADIVLVIMNRRGLEQLVANQFKIGADVAVAAGPVGRNAEASTDLQLRAQILSYSRSRGLFAGVTISGSTIRQDLDANQRFYGTILENRQIVLDGKAGSPEPVDLWRATLTKFAGAGTPSQTR